MERFGAPCPAGAFGARMRLHTLHSPIAAAAFKSKVTLFAKPVIKKYLLKKKSRTMVQISRLENIEHKIMKQVSYSGKYSLSASRAHQSHLQFCFVVGNAFCPRFLQV